MRFIRLILSILDDLLYLAGCGLVLRFVWLTWPVGTWLVAGLMLIGLGLMVGLGRVSGGQVSGVRYQVSGEEVRE